MSDAELNKRLRDFEKVTVGDARDAADRIEALTAKVKLMDDLDAINGEKIEALTKERDREKAYAFQCAINLDTALEQLTAARDDAKEAEAYAEELEAKLATCEKYRDAYDEMGRIGTQAVRDLEAKLSKTEGLLAMAMHVIKGRIHWEASGLTCDCGECQVLVATVAKIEGERHD